jgi:hypothetical protein
MDLMAEEQKDSSSQCSYHLVEYRKQRMQERGANRKTFVAPSTINRELGLLRNMLRLASEWYELDLKPLKFEMAKEEQRAKGTDSLGAGNKAAYRQFTDSSPAHYNGCDKYRHEEE